MRRAALVLVWTLALGGCLRDVDPYLGERHVVAGGEAHKAPAAMRKYGCVSCHTIPGMPQADAMVGPPLTHWAKRRYIAGHVPNSPDELVRWIIHPQGIKPGTAMPDMGVSGEDAKHIAAYLFELK